MEIKAELMTEESFSPFGTLLVPKKEHITFTSEFVKHYNELGNLGNLGQDPVVSFFVSYRRDFTITSLEKHINTCEVFFPVKGIALMPFAPSLHNGNPDINNMHVFICSEGQPFIGEKDVWHLFPFPINNRYEAFNVVEKSLIENDLFNYQLKIPVRITL